MQVPQKTAALIWMSGKEIKEQWALTGTVISIGRRDDNDVVVDDRSVSRHHAQIRRTGELHVVQDLDSRNGTSINGQRIAAPAALRDGDELQLGSAVRLLFVDSAPQARAPVPAAAGGLKLESEKRRVHVCGALLTPPLSRAQFTLLALLAEQPGRVCSRSEIISAVWPDDEAEGISDAAIDALLRRTRLRLLELDPDHNYIVTVRGHGFLLENTPQP